jgi:hypothetical protein
MTCLQIISEVTTQGADADIVMGRQVLAAGAVAGVDVAGKDFYLKF